MPETKYYEAVPKKGNFNGWHCILACHEEDGIFILCRKFKGRWVEEGVVPPVQRLVDWERPDKDGIPGWSLTLVPAENLPPEVRKIIGVSA